MEPTLNYIDRFFRILVNPSQKNNERFYSEWSYLVALLKSDHVSDDRIEAYLNILETHDSVNKIVNNKGKKSQTEHPNAKVFSQTVNEILSILEADSEKFNKY